MTRSYLKTSAIADAAPARIVPFPGSTPERLVGVGFRCWLAGFETGDLSSWETAWGHYESSVGADRAKPLVLTLSHFVRAVMANAERPIETYPETCRGFCRDECLAISIVAACQHDTRSALCTCARALLGSSDIGDAIDKAQEFACGLKCAGQVLNASSICSANCPLWTPQPRLQ